MTVEQEVTIARRASVWMARRDPTRPDPGEFLGAAWMRVRAAGKRTADAPLLSRAARRGVVDEFRSLHGMTPRGGPAPIEYAPVEYATAPAPVQPPAFEARLLAAWCEHRPRRLDLSPRVRLWAYLWLVEGWRQGEIAAVWGMSKRGVEDALKVAGIVGSRAAGMTGFRGRN